MCAAEVDHHVAQRYLLKRRLGKGAYGIVWKAVDRRTGEVVAIKKIFDAFRDKTDAQRTFREITLLQELGDHPNIIRLLDVIRAENDRDIYLVFESMDTDLNAVICKGRLLKDTHKRYIIYQLLRATKFIHSGHVIHRDQKPSNVLLDSSCLVKLCDFGLARSLGDLPEGPEGQALTDYVATRWYRAPEVLLSSSWVPSPCVHPVLPQVHPRGGHVESGLHPGRDAAGKAPVPRHVHTAPAGAHPGDHPAAIQGGPPGSWLKLQCLDPALPTGLPAPGEGTVAGARRPRQPLDTLLPPDTPPEALDLLRGLLVFAPDKRLSAAQALQHPYVQRFHCPAREWTLDSAVRLPVLEGVQLSAPEYRSRVYQMILERRANSRVPREKGVGGTPPGAEPGAPPPQAHLLRASAAPPPAPGSSTRNPGRRPQSGPTQRPAPDVACGAKSLPRQNSAPLLQPPPPRGEAQWQGDGALLRQAGRRPGGHPGPSPERLEPGPRAARQRCATGELPGRASFPPPSPGSGPSPPSGPAPHAAPAPRAGPSRASRGRPARAPARPEDVQRLGLAGGPGRRKGCARGLLSSVRYRLPLGTGPPAAAPGSPRLSRPTGLQTGSSAQPVPLTQFPAPLPARFTPQSPTLSNPLLPAHLFAWPHPRDPGGLSRPPRGGWVRFPPIANHTLQ
ncbi:mitogen-activated protein kinase 15 isoform X2 [Mustela erminea]|uniref:mitogen-activated protein kinase 15 isoform X2 n=1 Tax=Mustela erminea TaxID=36723 RepID=UPI001386814E|nr:mitogen-activated protein kinase 15 isoform X2 [Mustela erminea]